MRYAASAARGCLVVLVLVLACPGDGFAQSHLNAGGLGFLTEPLDARARALGGSGVGMEGSYLLGTDPAAAAELVLPSITATFQPSTSETEDGREAGGTRFPNLGASYPFGRHVLFIQMGSFLDQDWRAVEERTLRLSDRDVDAVDTFESSGGIGQARIGWATRVGESVAVGLSLGSFVGAVERSFSREMDPEQVGIDVDPFETAGRWRSSGLVAGAGVRWSPSELFTLGGSVEWTQDLTLDPVTPTEGPEREYPMPLTVRGGGTVSLAPDFSLALGASRADWSGVDARLGGNAARDVAWSYGAGVEWARTTILGRRAPVRLGYRAQDLPFHFQGEPADESVISGGLGLNLADAATTPIARMEVSLERGTRTAGSFEERFWRTTVSLRLAGG